jgi:Fungal Zn(2)-Cys(6) binuclear cluster domain
MPPNRGRASKACVTCRKQKTRCYANETSNFSCLRCDTLGLDCSLNITDDNASPSRSRPGNASGTDERYQNEEIDFQGSLLN